MPDFQYPPDPWPTNEDSEQLLHTTAALMRGKRADLQLGYTAKNAAYAAFDYKAREAGGTGEIPHDAVVITDQLIPFAEGFADGMAEAIERSMNRGDYLDPGEQFARHRNQPGYERNNAYDTGLAYGKTEVSGHIYPSLERVVPIQRLPERSR